MFVFLQAASSDKSNSQKEPELKTNVPVNSQKSQRYVEHDEIEADLNVSKSMQDFVYKKMSKKIGDSIEFVEICPKSTKKRKKDDVGNCVRLLKDTAPIKHIDFMPESLTNPTVGKKLEVKRRIVEPDGYDDDEKLKMVSVDGEQILKQTETKGWKSKKIKPNKLFNYHEKNSVLYYIEPSNEFTALRKKNNWTESKIANFPWKKS